jgi:hypothetical protein
LGNSFAGSPTKRQSWVQIHFPKNCINKVSGPHREEEITDRLATNFKISTNGTAGDWTVVRLLQTIAFPFRQSPSQVINRQD